MMNAEITTKKSDRSGTATSTGDRTSTKRRLSKKRRDAKGLRVLGQLTQEDVRRCETVVRHARPLENREKRKLALLT